MMRKQLRCALSGFTLLLLLVPVSALHAQDSAQNPVAPQAPLAEGDTGSWTPWSGRYRITPSDVLELTFPHVPEFDQEVTVQPDGYVTLKAAGDVRVQGRTLPEVQQQLYAVYEPILREPVINIVLKEFEKPFFIVAGEVKTPGKFDLRGALTVTQALAIAGGFSEQAKHSQVLLFRRFSPELLEVKQIDVKAMYSRRNLDEDQYIRPGDTIYVPRSLLSRVGKYIPVPGMGLYFNPFE